MYMYMYLDTLHQKKKKAIELSTAINGIKRNIDEVHVYIHVEHIHLYLYVYVHVVSFGGSFYFVNLNV